MALKIAVYAISKNEASCANRFLTNLDEADGVFVTDTGSVDDTVQLLTDRGVHVTRCEVQPWRFDKARNIALGAVPADYDICFSLDLDEVVSPGWRAEIESIWRAGAHRIRYNYVWNTLPDGRDGVTFWYDRIHCRHGFKWVKAVHEILQLDEGSREEVHLYSKAIVVRHYPEASKSRSAYVPLLELACREDSEDDRSAHYLGREYLHKGKYAQAIVELTRHLSLRSAIWKPERAASMRYISTCHVKGDNFTEAQAWALRACAEAPEEREPWVDLGTVMYLQRNYHGAYFAMRQALQIQEKPLTYICEPKSWGSYPYDIASLAAYHLGVKQESRRLCEKALELEPANERLRNNLALICGEIA